MSLEEYLAGQYVKDMQDLDSVEVLLVEVAETLEETFESAARGWPYQITSSGGSSAKGPTQGYSPGTVSMLLTAVAKFIDVYKEPNGKSSNSLARLDQSIKDKLNESFWSARQKLVETLTSEGMIKSRTFGANNPVTISQVFEFASSHELGSEVLTAVSPQNEKDQADNPKANIARWYDVFCRRGKLAVDVSCKQTDADLTGYSWSSESSFLALRLLKSVKWGANAELDPEPQVRKFFEAKLHEQLSFSSIPDSRFDPAELAFSLEGLLLCSKDAVDPILMKRVLEVLHGTQGTTAYWRPNRPFFYKDTGPMVLPLSVEGANSLLRSVELMDRKKLHDTCTSIAIPMFRRFFEWLRARKTILQDGGKRRVGWQSEHINTCDVIHLWDTSQIVEFLWGFRSLLRDHIARETLLLSGLKVEHPRPKEKERAKSLTGRWATITNDFEPILENAHIGKVFKKIGVDFIEPLERKEDPEKLCHSMLVYGPPGTGKTTVAENIATVLERRFITVTVSDFLGSGGAQVEARAKAIFQTLLAQQDCVIFFDEIDAFLLDRASTYYFEQDSLFQFLTPGMLTKINDLRNAKRSIFIIATNYENRIDPAAKRSGRIDRKYLLMPPDLARRKKIILDTVAGAFTAEELSYWKLEKKDDTSKDELRSAFIKGCSSIDRWADESCFLSYTQIRAELMQTVRNWKADGRDVAELEAEISRALLDCPRSTGVDDYLPSATQLVTNSGRAAVFPSSEFMNMVHLADEVMWPIKRSWSSLPEEVRETLRGLAANDVSNSPVLATFVKTD